MEELLYIPFSEFLCWLEWLGSGKALAVMWVFFLLGAFGKLPLRVLRKVGWEALPGSHCTSGNPLSQENQDQSRVEKDKESDSRMSQTAGRGLSSGTLSWRRSWRRPIQAATCHPRVLLQIANTCRKNGQQHEYLVIFPGNSWKRCALGQLFPS